MFEIDYKFNPGEKVYIIDHTTYTVHEAKVYRTSIKSFMSGDSLKSEIIYHVIYKDNTLETHRFESDTFDNYQDAWKALYGTPTPTRTRTATPTPTRTRTPTLTASLTPTLTPTRTQTVTPTITPSRQPSPTPTSTRTPTVTRTATITPTITPTSTVTPTVTRTASITPSVTATLTPSPTATVTATITPSATVTPTVTSSVTPSATVTPSVTATVTPSPTAGVTPTITPSATVTATVTPTVTITPTATETPVVSPTPTVTATITPSVSPTSTPTMTPTMGVTITPTQTFIPTVTASPTLTVTPTVTQSVTPSMGVTLTPTPTPSPTIPTAPFDYAALSIEWELPNGEDADPHLIVAYPERDVYVGWGQSSNDNGYVIWAGDHQGTSGQEAFLIDVIKLKQDYPLIGVPEFNLFNLWYTRKFDGNVRIILRTYRGGLMYNEDHDWVNVGGVQLSEQSWFANSDVVYDGVGQIGNMLGTLVYDGGTGTWEFDVQSPAVTPTPTVTPTSTVTPAVTSSVTPTATRTVTPTISITPTISLTPTNTATPTITPSITPTISVTPSVTPTISLTPTITPTNTATPTMTATITVTPSVTPTISLTPTITPTVTRTVTATVTPSADVTPTMTRTITDTPTPTATNTATPTPTPSITVTISITPTISVTPSVTPGESATATPTASVTPSVSVTATPTPTPETTKSGTPAPTPTSTATPTATATVTPTISLTPSVTPAVTSTATPTPEATPTRTPAVTATATVTPTITPTITPSSSASVPVMTWYTKQSAGSGLLTLKSIDYSPTRAEYVAVADTGPDSRIIKSTDSGATWQTITPPALNVAWQRARWIPEKSLWFVLGYNNSGSPIANGYYSPDLVTWTAIGGLTGTNQPNMWLSDIAWSESLQLYAMSAINRTTANLPTLVTSASLTGPWNTRTTSDTNGYGPGGVQIMWNSTLNHFLMVGHKYISGQAPSFNVYVSSNGSSWTEYNFLGNGGLGRGVAYSPTLGLYVAVSEGNPRIHTSTNGTTWTHTANTTATWTNVSWSPEHGAFILVGTPPSSNSSVISATLDGTTLFPMNVPDASESWQGVVWSSADDQFVAVAGSTTDPSNNKIGIGKFGSLPVTVTPTMTPSPTATPVLANFTVYAANDNPQPSNAMQDIVYDVAGDKYVAISSSGVNRSFTSTDGRSWTPTNIGSTTWNGVAFSPSLNRYVAVRQTANGTPPVQYSDDGGVTWVNGTFTSNQNGSTWNKVTWSSALNLFVAVANSGISRIITSPDGITWTDRMTSSMGNSDVFGVAWSSGTRGLSFGNQNIRYTDDGINWTLATNYTLNSELRAAAYSPTKNRWVVVGSGTSSTTRIGYSDDNGLSWTSLTTTQSLYCITWSTEYECFVAGGASGYLAKSPDGTSWQTISHSFGAPLFRAITWSAADNVFVLATSTGTNNLLYMQDSTTAPTPTRTVTPTVTPTITPTITPTPSVGQNFKVLVDSSPNMPDTGAWYGVAYSESLQRYVAISQSSPSSTFGAYSSDGRNWSPCTGLTHVYYNIAYSPTLNRFVAGISAATGQMAYSDDGITWTEYTVAALPYAVYAIRWIPEKSMFFAGMSGRVAYSSDGINWSSSAVTGGSALPVCVAYSPTLDLLVATGFSGNIWTSTNGTTWTQRPSSGTAQLSNTVWDSAHSSFVSYGEVANGQVSYSTNGITWALRSPSTPLIGNISSAQYIPSRNTTLAVSITSGSLKFVDIVNAVSGTGIGVSYPILSGMRSAVWSETDQQYVAVGMNGRVAILGLANAPFPTPTPTVTPTISTTPSPTVTPTITPSASPAPQTLSWVATTTPSATEVWRSIAYSPTLDRLVAVGNAGARVATSDDGGDTWVAQTPGQANTWVAVVWADTLNLFVAVSQDGVNRVMTSPDGINWTGRTAAQANTWLNITWSNTLGLLVAVSFDGANRVMTSPDGINWTARTAASANQWYGVVWASALNLFVAVSADGAQRAMTSPDGINWTVRTTPSNPYYALTWSPDLNLLVATGGGSAMSSPDGINWTQRSVPQTGTWASVTWSPSKGAFVAVSTGISTNRVMISFNGVVWTIQTNASMDSISWYGVTWVAAKNRYLAGGASGNIAKGTYS